jgi:hypothetical protein
MAFFQYSLNNNLSKSPRPSRLLRRVSTLFSKKKAPKRAEQHFIQNRDTLSLHSRHSSCSFDFEIRRPSDLGSATSSPILEDDDDFTKSSPLRLRTASAPEPYRANPLPEMRTTRREKYFRLSDLPVEVLSLVLSFLPTNTASSLAVVSKRVCVLCLYYLPDSLVCDSFMQLFLTTYMVIWIFDMSLQNNMNACLYFCPLART